MKIKNHFIQYIAVVILLSLPLSGIFGQTTEKQSSNRIYESIQKLNFLGSALYIAAHPDDENTAMISYLANGVHAQTAYFSVTRGDGGQNLIGPEIGELLGVIRTEELLQARRIDGGIQFFSRAKDFGYSKNPEETLEFWHRQEVLRDLLQVIIEFRPDVIINRFDHRTPGTTHGHHTTSAMLGVEAFELITNNRPELKTLIPLGYHPPKRIMFNQSWWFYGSQEKFDNADKSKLFVMDIGDYYPTLGMSNNEISALSRSQHSSQGFGARGVRGEVIEYLETVGGTPPVESLFDGVDTTWNRVKGGKAIGDILQKVEKDFDFKNPSASIPELLKAYKLIQKLEDTHWRNIKTQQIEEVIANCAGLFLEAVSPSSTVVAGESINIKYEAVNRSTVPVKINSVSVNKTTVSQNAVLENNRTLKFESEFKIPENQKPTSPYWLDEAGTLGMYKVKNPKLTGMPETPPPFVAQFDLDIAGEKLVIERPLIHKYLDAAKGEVYQPFAVVPKASVKVDEDVLVFSDNQSKEVAVRVKSFTDNLTGELSLKAPEGWKIEPPMKRIELAKKEEVKTYRFFVYPPNRQEESELIPQLKIGNAVLNQNLYEIDYEHIPAQKVLLPGSAKIVNIDIKKKGNRIAYIAGAGDSVPENLKQIGYEVEILAPENITAENLSRFDAVMLGVRAFNVIPELNYKNQILFDYVKNGGNMVVQYNVSSSLLTKDISPFPLTLSRDRVTDENSDVILLNKEHPVLNTPNKITEKDFEGWVQERGLYFPNQWDKAFTPVLSMHDKGEDPMNGSLLVAQYGKGYYVYTGLSFFRELPAGVPGAYRLIANILSLGK